MARRSVFISYARDDRPDVEESAALLRAGGVRIFIDLSGIDYGERWQDALHQALDKCERVMVFWSIAAAASEWVEKEWRYALAPSPYGYYGQARLRLRRAGEVGLDPTSTEASYAAARAALHEVLREDRLAAYSDAERRALLDEALQAGRRTNELRKLVGAGHASAPRGEVQAFFALADELDATAERLRRSLPAAVPIKPAPQPPGPPEPHRVARPEVLTLVGLAFGLVAIYWLRRRLQAAAFVDAVFNA